MIQYGLISETDARVIEKTLDLICDETDDKIIHVTEIGIYSGETGSGINQYVNSKGKNCFLIGIDNMKDGQEVKYEHAYSNQIKGNSTEVYNQLEDNSQHMIFCDGDHSMIGVVSDFFAYASKVKVGGYFCFHDTGCHIAPFTDFQHGDKENPDAYISVRKALKVVGLFSSYLDYAFDAAYPQPKFAGWEFIFDEADETNRAGGICAFQKLY